ncbi:hypothetical protein C9374_007093 [Naegleria lovaniensis]|uniref:Uncharacterized protein n=1 Tax=Naegleria lovaniensis TaxID=51637 RepID=A0AA88KRV1_NAELO|nr:uncharacterized protein C9374_007093 [Naegleria lovaniensis]KAG2393562.1 hypothetical protein C9374_007093 [Naegleria lovaniensis]
MFTPPTHLVVHANHNPQATAASLKRSKRVKYYNDREIYDDIINAERDEFVDDVPIITDDSDEDHVEYENFIACGSGHQRVVDKIDSDLSSSDERSSIAASPQQQQQASRLLFNPFMYYKNLVDQDLQNSKYYGEQLHKKQLRQLQPGGSGATPEDPTNYNDIAKKYANNLANHAKYLYKYRSFAPAAYRKYIVNVYEYSKRVVEVAKVQNWNGFLYYLNVVVEYYRKIEVLEQVGYGVRGEYVQTTPVATYNAAVGSPQYYGTGLPPAATAAGAAVASTAAVGAAQPYPAYGYPAANAAAYYPYAARAPYGAYGGYPAAYYGYGYPNSYYYPQQQYYPVATGMNYAPAATVAAAATKSDPSKAESSASPTSSSTSNNANSGSASTGSSSNTSSSAANTNQDTSSTAATSNETKSISTASITKKLKTASEDLSSHVGTFGDDAVPSEPFTFELLI